MEQNMQLESPLSTVAEPSTATPRKKLERSCLACHRRKIRCSKELPCAACLRTGVACSYPQSERKHRAPRTRITDIATRISQLEKTLVSTSRASETPTRLADDRETTGVATVETPYSPHSQTQDGGKEALVSNQYFNEDLLSRVIEQEQDIQSALATPRDNPPKLRPYNPMGILSNTGNFTGDLVDLHPSKQAAIQLWHAFVKNIEPAVKVFHTPTTEVTVYSVIDNPRSASPDILALVFSIYFTATIPLDSDEAEKLLGRDKESGLMLLKTGIEQAFAEADFLNHTNIVLLQALAVYLMGIRSHNPGRGVWILTGLAVRAAESIGLHRDGKKLKLTPFESEMRRRIWWHIVGRDGRSSEDYGISSSTNVPIHAVELPLNIDDNNLYPEMTELPPPGRGWTQMTLPLVGIELYRARQQIQMALSSTPLPSRAVRDRILKELQMRMELHIQRCNPIIPVQRMTIFVYRFTFAKLEFVSGQQWQCIENPSQPDSFSNEALRDACQALQIVIDSWDDELLNQFRYVHHPFRDVSHHHPVSWMSLGVRSFTQYHLPLYILWHLCVHPQGPDVARAWETIETLFELQGSGALQLSASVNGSKWGVLQVLKEKAAAIRAALRSQDKTLHTATSNPQPTDEAPVDQVGDILETNLDFENNPYLSQVLEPLPDWNAFWMDELDFGSHT